MSIFKKGNKIIPVPRSNDIFGCIDLCAKKEDKWTLWIQATLDSNRQKKIDDLAVIPWGVGDRVEIWMKRKTGEVDIYGQKSTIPNEFEHKGKIIRRKLYVTEGQSCEY